MRTLTEGTSAWLVAPTILLALTGCTSPPPPRIVETPPLMGPYPAEPSDGGATVAPPAVNWTLGISRADALALAGSQGPKLAAARKRIGVAQAALVTAGTYPWNPVLELWGDQNKVINNEKEGQISAKLTQAIETGGQLGRRVELAAAERDLSLAEYANQARLVQRECALVYAELVYRGERLTLARSRQERAKQVLDVAERRMAAKDLPEAEVNLVRLEERQAVAELEISKREREAARLRLLAMIGELATRQFEARSSLFPPTARPVDAADLKARALAKRPDLRAAELSIEKAERKGDLARADRWPTIAVSVGFARDVSYIGLRHDVRDADDNLGLGLLVPLPLFDRRQGPILEAAAERDQASADLDALKVEIRREVDDTANRVALAASRLAIYDREVVPLAEKSLELTREAYRIGKAGTLEVLRAQDELQKVRLARLEALYEHDQAIVELSAVTASQLPDDEGK